MSKPELELFDCNCMLGRTIFDQGSSFDDVTMLRTHMERYCISKSLVFYSSAKFSWPREGNERLSEETRGAPDIYTAWVALPGHTGEFFNAAELKKRIGEEKVSAVRLCPKNHSYSTSDWCCGELLSALGELHIPVFLDYDIQHWSNPQPWDEIYRLCRSYPDIPFVLTRVACSANRNLFPLLDQCANLHFEISYYEANRGIETVTERFGAKRMLFGTNAPIHAPSCAIGLLYYSAISDGDKRKIAKENMETLIRGIRYDG